jgi:DNA-binding response OmpR family regulator
VQKILVVGDGESSEEIARQLGDAGYDVEQCRPAVLPKTLASKSSPAALVFDLSQASGSPALDVLVQQEASNRTPTLAVLSEEYVLLEENELRANDFVLYPLRAGELTARLRHLVGRPEPESSDVLRQGALLIDLASYRVYVEGALVDLTYKEYELLRFLATHPDRVFTREALLDKVWGYDFYGGARTVDVHIRRLRSKLEHGGRIFIETVRSVGYRFHAS